MAIDFGASLAPQSLTMREVLEVTADAMIIGGLAHRAITRAGIWSRKDALYGRAEDALETPFSLARQDLDEWLADMKADGAPRFFNSEMLGNSLREISQAYTRLFNSIDDDAALEALVEELAMRDFTRLLAGEAA
jgi:hypothetical protein